MSFGGLESFSPMVGNYFNVHQHAGKVFRSLEQEDTKIQVTFDGTWFWFDFFIYRTKIMFCKNTLVLKIKAFDCSPTLEFLSLFCDYRLTNRFFQAWICLMRGIFVFFFVSFGILLLLHFPSVFFRLLRSIHAIQGLRFLLSVDVWNIWKNR